MGIEALFTPQLPQADWRIVAAAQRPDALGALTQGVNLGNGLADLYRQNQFRQAMQDTANAGGEMDTGTLLKALALYGDPKYLAALVPEMYKERTQQQAMDLASRLAGGGGAAGGTATSSGDTAATSSGGTGYNRQAMGLAALSGLPGMSGYGQVANLMNAPALEDYKHWHEIVNGISPSGIPFSIERGRMPMLQQPGQPPATVQPQSYQPKALNSQQQQQLLPYVIDAAKQSNIDPRLLRTVLQVESGFNSNPSGRNDGGHSGGIAQLNDRGAGADYQISPTQAAADPIRSIYIAGDYVSRRGLLGYNGGGDPAYLAKARKAWIELGYPPQEFGPVVVQLGRGSGAGPRPDLIGPTQIAQADTTVPNPGNNTASDIPAGGWATGLAPGQKAYQEAGGTAAGKFPYEQTSEALTMQRKRENAYKLAEDEARAKKNVELSENWQKESDNATNAIQFIRDAKNLVQQGISDPGKLSPLKGLLGEWLYSSGFADASNPFIQQAAKNRQFESIANQLTLNLLGGKLGAQISDSDRNFITRMLPQIGDNPVAATGILDRLEKMFSRAQERNNTWIDAKANNPDLREPDFERQWQAHLKQVWAQEDKDRKSGSTVSSGPATVTPDASSSGYVLRFPTGVNVSKEQAEAWPPEVQKMIADRIRSGQVRKLRVP